MPTPEQQEEEKRRIRDELLATLAPLGESAMPPIADMPRAGARMGEPMQNMVLDTSLPQAPPVNAIIDENTPPARYELLNEFLGTAGQLGDMQLARPDFAPLDLAGAAAPPPAARPPVAPPLAARAEQAPPEPLQPPPRGPAPGAAVPAETQILQDLLKTTGQLGDMQLARPQLAPLDLGPGPAAAPAPGTRQPLPDRQGPGQPAPGQPPPGNALQAAVRAAEERIAKRAAGGGSGGGMQSGPSYDLPAPPMRDVNKGGLIFAAFADLFLNNGRGAGNILKPLIEGDIPYENYQRKAEHAKLLADNARARGVRADDQDAKDLAFLRYAQGDTRLTHQIAEGDRKVQQDADDNDPSSQRSRDAVEAATRLYPDKAKLFAGASRHELEKAGYLKEAYAEDRAGEATKARYSNAAIANALEANRQRNRYAMADYTEGQQIAGEARKTQATIDDEKRERRAIFAAGETDMITLEEKLRAAIAKKGANYRLPTEGGFLSKAWTEGVKAVEGGSGMDFEDTDLVASVRGSALPDYINIAHNSPNNEGERAQAFEKWFSDGTLGGMLRFLEATREQGFSRVQAVEGALDTADQPLQRQRSGGGGGGGGRRKPAPAAAPAGAATITLYDPQTKLSRTLPDTPRNRQLAADKKMEIR